MPQFTTLQKKLFPVYFRTQVLLICLTAFTHPMHSFFSFTKYWYDILPLAVAFTTSLQNMVQYGPRTSGIMVERVHQETRDGHKYNEAVNQSKEMQAINRRFSRAHAMTIHLNLLTIVCTLWYGASLASRLRFEA